MTLPAFRELPSERRAAQRADLMAALRRPRRRRIVTAVTVGIVALAAAPTLAFHRQLVEFASGDPAPKRIQLDFEFLREHSREAHELTGSPEITPAGTAREVMRVTIDGESRPFWVLPTAEGGFCYRLHHFGSCRIPGHDDAFGGGGLANRGGEGWAWTMGRVLDRRIEEIVLLYQDGARTTLPYVWVSPPIDAGFFAYEVPEEHRQPGRLTAVLLGLDDDGKTVLEQCLPLAPGATEARGPEVAEHCPPRARRDAGG
jgi:hypothetical protein